MFLKWNAWGASSQRNREAFSPHTPSTSTRKKPFILGAHLTPSLILMARYAPWTVLTFAVNKDEQYLIAKGLLYGCTEIDLDTCSSNAGLVSFIHIKQISLVLEDTFCSS